MSTHTVSSLSFWFSFFFFCYASENPFCIEYWTTALSITFSKSNSSVNPTSPAYSGNSFGVCQLHTHSSLKQGTCHAGNMSSCVAYSSLCCGINKSISALKKSACAGWPGTSNQSNTIDLEVSELFISGYIFMTTLHSCNNNNKRSFLFPLTAWDKIRIANFWKKKICKDPNYEVYQTIFFYHCLFKPFHRNSR